MKRLKETAIMLLMSVLFSLPNSGSAAEIGGVVFVDELQTGDVAFSLQGVGLLKWARLFDVYAVAFYLPAERAAGDWRENIAKHLELAYFREIEAQDFARSSDQLLQRNLATGEYQALQQRLQTFYQLFRDVRPGDRYALTYRPGDGTELSLNGQLLGSVPGHDFAVAYFGLWLGESPISEHFRNRLLGAGGG